MPRLLDRLLIVDLESTCWEEEPPPGQVSEIIEIGVAVIDLVTVEPVERHAILVKPTKSEVSEFCTRLTTLDARALASGVEFPEAIRQLRKLRSKDRMWASWGDYDRRQFERMCDLFEVNYPFGPGHLNVKSLYALMRGLPRECGMADAIEREGLSLEGTHHRGVDDAWNIAKLLCELLRSGRTEKR